MREANKGQINMKSRKVSRSCKVINSDPEANRATFKCSNCGHEWQGIMFKKSPIGTIPSVEMRRKFAGYWGQRVTTFCPGCSVVKG